MRIAVLESMKIGGVWTEDAQNVYDVKSPGDLMDQVVETTDWHDIHGGGSHPVDEVSVRTEDGRRLFKVARTAAETKRPAQGLLARLKKPGTSD